MADRTLLIPSVEDTILQGAEAVIDRSIVALNHPSGTTVNDVIYANPRNSKLDLTKLQIRNGVWKIAPTSLGLGSSISFNILNRSLIMGLYLTGSIQIPAYGQLISNWFYYLINFIQFQISGINNLQYTGISLRDMYLLEASNARRNYLSTLMPPILNNTASTVPYDFIVPLPFFFNEGMLATKGFVLDANTLSSTMQLNINFNPLYTVMAGVTGHTLTYPTSFDSLYMKTYAQMDHLTQEFASHRISNIFRIPFNFVQYYSLINQPVPNTGPTGVNTLQLQQLPQGELLRIVLSASDASQVGTLGGTSGLPNMDPVQFSYLRLTLNGNDMVLLESQKQVYNQMLYNSVGDDAATQYTSYVYAGNTGGAAIAQQNNLTTLDCFVPAVAGSMYESEFSVAESFNGQIFQLYYTIAGGGISTLNWNITYLSNGIMSIENGEAKLQT